MMAHNKTTKLRCATESTIRHHNSVSLNCYEEGDVRQEGGVPEKGDVQQNLVGMLGRRIVVTLESQMQQT